MSLEMATTDPVNESSSNAKNESESNHEIPIDTTQWTRLFDWIHCICVVTFDLELGQAMEVNMIDKIPIGETVL